MDKQNRGNELNFNQEISNPDKEQSFYEILKKERTEIINSKSIRELGNSLAQRTTPGALDKIVEFVNSAKRILREKRNITRNNDVANKDDVATLSVEEMIVGEMQIETDIKKTSNDRER